MFASATLSDGTSLCYSDKTSCLKKFIEPPENCPESYKETTMVSTCVETIETIGFKVVPKCENWHTCAQPGYDRAMGCKGRKRFIRYIARKCVQGR